MYVLSYIYISYIRQKKYKSAVQINQRAILCIINMINDSPKHFEIIQSIFRSISCSSISGTLAIRTATVSKFYQLSSFLNLVLP